MTARAFPPSSFHCVSGNSSGTSFILCIIPLPCNVRICSGKVIDTLFYFTICADRARASMHTGMDNGLPFITAGIHQIFCRDFSFISSGRRGRFLSDHSSARAGCFVFRSLNPFNSLIPLQNGHLLPPARVDISVSHSWPFSHRHHTILFAPAGAWSGVHGRFLGDHSFASSG